MLQNESDCIPLTGTHKIHIQFTYAKLTRLSFSWGCSIKFQWSKMREHGVVMYFKYANYL